MLTEYWQNMYGHAEVVMIYILYLGEMIESDDDKRRWMCLTRDIPNKDWVIHQVHSSEKCIFSQATAWNTSMWWKWPWLHSLNGWGQADESDLKRRFIQILFQDCHLIIENLGPIRSKSMPVNRIYQSLQSKQKSGVFSGLSTSTHTDIGGLQLHTNSWLWRNISTLP